MKHFTNVCRDLQRSQRHLHCAVCDYAKTTSGVTLER